MSRKLWTAVTEGLPSARARRVYIEGLLKSKSLSVPGETLLGGLKTQLLLAPFPPVPGGGAEDLPAHYVNPNTGYHIAGERIDRWCSRAPSFEETVFTLFACRRPRTDELEELTADLAERRRKLIDGSVIRDAATYFETTIGDRAVGGHIDFMSVAAMAIPLFSVDSRMARLGREEIDCDPLEARFQDSLDLIVQIGVLTSIIYRTVIRQHSDIPWKEMKAAEGYSESILAGFGIPADDEVKAMRIRVLDALLAVMSYHGMGNVSTFSSLVGDSGGATVHQSHGSLIGGLIGPQHGGAAPIGLRFLLKLQARVGAHWDQSRLVAEVLKRLDRTPPLPILAIGHGLLRLLPDTPPEERNEPRTRTVLALLNELFPNSSLFRLAQSWYATAIPIIKSRKKLGFDEVNVDGYTGVLATAAGLIENESDARLMGGIFLTSRTAGMVAAQFYNNAWQEKGVAPLYRPGEWLPEPAVKS